MPTPFRTIAVKPAGEHKGFCRKYYSSIYSTTLYCLQEDAKGQPPVLYICTQGGEPSRPLLANLKTRDGHIIHEIP